MTEYLTAEALEEAIATVEWKDFDNPVGFNPKTAQEKTEAVHSAIESAFGESMTVSDQDTSDYARLSLPKSSLLEPDNPYACIILSRVPDFATITYEWDVKPEALQYLKSLLERLGFDYVSYRIFANPEDNWWKYDCEWQYHNVKPPPGKGVILNEDLWHGLFDYS